MKTPKEKQKQHLIDMMKYDEELGLYEEPKQENCCTPIGQIKRYIDCKGCDRKPKQEITLEEAAKKYATNQGMMAYVFPEKEKSFIDGAKWQQERRYSDMKNIKIKITKEQSDLFKHTGNIVSLSNGDVYMNIPYWLKETDKENVYEHLTIEQLPDDIKNERMYSEEELEVAFFEGRENNLSFIEWFKQYKNK